MKKYIGVVEQSGNLKKLCHGFTDSALLLVLALESVIEHCLLLNCPQFLYFSLQKNARESASAKRGEGGKGGLTLPAPRASCFSLASSFLAVLSPRSLIEKIRKIEGCEKSIFCCCFLYIFLIIITPKGKTKK